MILSTFFTDAGVPKTGLSPTIIITDITNIASPVLVVLANSVVEVGNGLYAFNFAEYIHTHLYTVRIDGGVALDDSDRYKFGAIDTDNNILNTEIEAIKADTAATLVDTGTLKSDTGILKTDIDELQVDTDALLGDTGILKADTIILKADTAILKGDTTTLKSDVDGLEIDMDTVLVDTGIIKGDTAILKADTATIKADLIIIKGNEVTVIADTGILKTGITDIKGTGWLSDDNLHVIHDSIQYGDWTDAEKKQIRSALGIDGDKVTAMGGQLQTSSADVTFIKKIEGGRWKRDGVKMTFYAEDNTTIVAEFNLFDRDGSPAGEADNVYERVRL